MTSTVEVIRGEVTESRHVVSYAVVDAEGNLTGADGDPGLVTYWRSAAKFFQAVPLIADETADALGVDAEELALACASHNGEERHVATARRLLGRVNATDDDLVCGAHSSLSDRVAKEMAARGERPSRAHSNCSGKHAAMIAVARHNGWPAGYADPEHPVQKRCLEEVALWSGCAAASIRLGLDGCGVPCFALPVRAMALAYARLAAAADGQPPPDLPAGSIAAARRLVAAVRTNPFLIAGTGRLDTDLLEATGGRVIAKVGAEGVYCAAIPEMRLGLALKVEDGATRAAGPALLGLLGALDPSLAPNLDAHRCPEVRNTAGVPAGFIRARVELRRTASV